MPPSCSRRWTCITIVGGSSGFNLVGYCHIVANFGALLSQMVGYDNVTGFTL
jgi:hypothetical protein